MEVERWPIDHRPIGVLEGLERARLRIAPGRLHRVPPHSPPQLCPHRAMFKLPRAPRRPRTMPAPGALPLQDYFSALGYLALLLGSCIAFLPRSTDYFYAMAALERSQRTSADRPEHPLLTPLTAHPAATAAWCAAGVGITMVWWGAKMARWWGAPQTFGEVSWAGETTAH